MTLTTIPIEKDTRNKLRELATKSESWDKLMNRLYENTITMKNAEIFFSADTLTLDDALNEIDKW